MKKIKFILPVLALSLFSCSDYLDINTSPNDPNSELITPNLALASAETNTYRPLVRNANTLGNLFMNNWGYNVNSFAVTSSEELNLQLNNNSYAAIWDGWFTSTANFSNIINHPSVEYDNHKAIAKIMKSFYFQYLVDLYGDIPYFEIHQGSANLTPAYDDDKAIYRDLVVQIDEAIAMIDNPVTGTNSVGGEDVILNGDMAAWKRFANTLKLRILMRQSEVTDAETTTYLADQFATLAGASFVNNDVTINPGYSNAQNDQQNPYYSLMFELDGIAERQTYRLYRASDYFADELNGTPPDPRRGRLWTLIGGQVVGVIQGDVSQQSGGTAPLEMSKLGPGVVISNDQDGFIMLEAESLLLQAEAVHRGYLAGDAQSLFDNAIRASFRQLGSSDIAARELYITEVNIVAGKGYGTGTPAEKIEAIMYQKNVALTGTNAIEVFIEHTRTKVIDQIPLALGTTGNKPRRLLYPNSEIVGNTANVPTFTLDQAFSTGAFWFVP